MDYHLLGIPGGYQMLWVVVAILVLFGGRKIPELMKGLGKGIREFKDASSGDTAKKDEIEKE